MKILWYIIANKVSIKAILIVQVMDIVNMILALFRDIFFSFNKHTWKMYFFNIYFSLNVLKNNLYHSFTQFVFFLNISAWWETKITICIYLLTHCFLLAILGKLFQKFGIEFSATKETIFFHIMLLSKFSTCSIFTYVIILFIN